MRFLSKGEMLDAGEVKGWEPALVRAHVALLHDAGYLHAALARGHAVVRSAMVKDVTAGLRSSRHHQEFDPVGTDQATREGEGFRLDL